MSWVRIDDAAPDHPKLIGLDDDAFALWVRGLCYCARHGTDGKIPLAALRTLTSSRQPAKVAEKLVRAGLWNRPAEAAYEVHDFLEYNPSAAAVHAKREARAEAGRKGGIRSGHVRSKDEANGEAIASGVASTMLNPVPSRPDPVPIPDPPVPPPEAPPGQHGAAGLGSPMAPDLLALASQLAAEGNGLGQSVCDRATQGRPPTPNQRAALVKIRDERAAAGAPFPPAPQRQTAREPTPAELLAMEREGERYGMSPAVSTEPAANGVGGHSSKCKPFRCVCSLGVAS